MRLSDQYPLRRREFHRLALNTAISGAIVNETTLLGDEPSNRYRVGVIGHTGRGDYGHGLDDVWQRIPSAEIVGVADANAPGLKRELQKWQLADSAGYLDYHKMLADLRPDVVAVCPRHVDQHHEMIRAAITAGAKGIYVEKPFVRLPSQADEVIALADQHGTKIAVAHRNRYHPTLRVIDQLIQDGRIGKLLEIRGRGKSDRRGGAEDLWVLGSHVLNLMAYFGGPAKSCSAVMLQDGQRVTSADVYEGAEGLGLLAGNELHARYRMQRGVVGYFDSIANEGTGGFGFGLQLIGSLGMIHIRCDASPLAHLIPGNPFQPTAKSRPWLPITSAGVNAKEPIEDLRSRLASHVIPVEDLLSSIRENRLPVCDANQSALTIEMICAVFESHRQAGQEVMIPLEHRGHALSKLR